ncbi:MAG: polymer-forming cytoskeletal protein [Alphaproteobacteria bacterium]|nr:polymer-forming cytoskeletal protein [Alphaproteobacteria bacterium]
MKKFRRMLYLKIARMGRSSNATVPSIISFGTKIKGNILGGDVIHIDGRLEGNVVCEELIIGVKGQIVGQVKAKSLSLYGTLQGSAEAENVFIASGAHLTGDAVHKSIAIEPGAYIEGRCIRVQPRPEIKPELKEVSKKTELPLKIASGDK